MPRLTVGLIGNPNAGKTTLFNQLTGARQRVGNWAGVTVERKSGEFTTASQQVTLVDLPGTYSLSHGDRQTSLDEEIACRYVDSGEAALFINVVDAANLERNLWLTLQLLERNLPCIVVLNMLDVAASQQIRIDVAALSARLGCPVVPMVSTRAQGLAALREAIDAFQHRRSPQQIAVRSLPAGADTDTDEALARYQRIDQLCAAVSNSHQAQPHRATARIDRWVLNRWLGVPLFLLVMYLMFLLAINVGGALQPLFDIGSAALFIQGTQWLGATLHFPGWLTLFLAQGIGGGINTVMPLVPQIGLMYLFLSLLEDSGYMARAAFVIDRLMQALGLPGKSFVPLIVGFGCNVPAVMGTRTLESPRERLTTIMMAPFMSCGARLAIFAVFAAAFFGQGGAAVVFSLYLLGILVAVFTGLMLKATLMRGSASPFVMELPVYHLPHLKTLLLQTWQRLRGFILRAGKIIILVSLVIGALNSFSLRGEAVDNINQSALASVSQQITPLLGPMGVSDDNWQATVGLITGAMAKEVVVGTLNTLYTAEQLHQQPFDPATFSLTNALRAALSQTWQGLREIVSLSVLANPIEASKGDGEMATGAMGIMSSKFGSGVAAYSYLIFVLLYVPCVSVMGAIAREAHRGWMLFSIGWGLNVAWSIATLFYQIATFSQHPGRSLLWVVGIVAVNLLLLLLLRRARHWRSLSGPGRVAAPTCSGCDKGCHGG
ncbi:Fe(2+) transporter permease subunit FeoB [Pantoea sp. 1.19]|uniref:Fe(2+) transporter permease subunit FeoB n=1 Tax=Pantoea sp. 1.19 TaxID=1925589 RepID=UPI000949070D|nr:Fe(2+) transporter permease subunit FeoB [Pantoea sp. 1.19]